MGTTYYPSKRCGGAMYFNEINRFLKAIKQSQLDYKYHYENVNIKNKETQDLLHQIELGKYKDRDKIATKLAKVRRERRVFKDIVENTEAINKYIEENKKAINGLTQLLGQVRNAEKSHEGRTYIPKIRKDLTI
jgi:hypothetical protein